MKTSADISIRVESGRLRGVMEGSVAVFRNVPFGRPPVGERRFAPAVRVEPWSGVRDATRAGVGAVQRRVPDDPWNGYLNPVEQGDDMLTLEVCTPVPSVDARLPVMVWIHGGGFTEGVGSAPAHRGHTFARDGVVHVSINYRLGIDGFGLLEDSVGTGAENLGLRDQIAALEWVRRNVHRFGGDPDRVTVAGQSAGAISVLCLMSTPLARGLFARAIVESGFVDGVRDLAEAARARASITRATGRPATRAGLRDLTLDETRQSILDTVGTFDTAAIRKRGKVTDLPFMPTAGTPSLPEAPLTGAATGTGGAIPLLIGTARDELAGILASAGVMSRWAAPLTTPLLRRFGAPRGAARVYRSASRRGARSAVVLSAGMTDAVARMPAIHLAEDRPGRTYLYEFTWQSPGLPPGLGADHVVDVPFVRDDFATFRSSCPVGSRILGEEPPQELAAAMHEAFVGFVTTGDPGWAPYDTRSRATMRFDTESQIVPDLAGAERQLWARSAR